MTPLLETERLRLRPFDRVDVPHWFQWFNDSKVTVMMNKGAFPNSEVAQEEFLQRLSDSRSDLQLAISLKETGELIGAVGIHKIDWIHRHGDISVVIGDSRYWGQGLAAEAIAAVVGHAFTKLNFHKLTAGLWANNTGCRRAFEKTGFVLEGKARQQFFCKNEYVDEIRLGLLREEWASRKGVGS